MVWVWRGAVKVWEQSKLFEGADPQAAEKMRVGHLYVYMSCR
jgi:hypothetical protein